MPSRKRSPESARLRRAYSILEVVVVVALLGLLATLILGAVQRVRAAAVRTQCANHLRQLGLALHQYHDARSHLPPGVSSPSNPDRMPFLGWPARLLPYLEQQALWDQAVTAFGSEPNFLRPPHPGDRSVGVFLCPLDGRIRGEGSEGFQKVRRGFLSYLGVSGTNPAKEDGILYLDSATRLASVADGTSNTLAAGERPPSANFVFGWWYGGWGQEMDGTCDLTLGVRTKNRSAYDPGCPTGPFPFAAAGFTDPCHHFQFWSAHPGGAHFLFADGSVRFLRYDADSILPALATRAGSEPVTLPD